MQREDCSQCSVVMINTISRTHQIRRRMILVATTEEVVVQRVTRYYCYYRVAGSIVVVIVTGSLVLFRVIVRFEGIASCLLY